MSKRFTEAQVEKRLKSVFKKGRLSDCEVEFDIPDSGDYVFRLINYSTNPVTVASAEIETER